MPTASYLRRFVLAKQPLSRAQLLLVACLWLLGVCNPVFWSAVWQDVGGISNSHPLFLLSLPLVAGSWLYLLLGLLCWSKLTKPVLMLLLLSGASTSYFMRSYGVMIDADMLNNVLQTDSAEVRDLLSPGLLLWLTLAGLLPAYWVWRTPLKARGFKRELAGQLGALAVALALLLGGLFSFYQPYAALLRNHREVRLQLVPSNVLAAAHSQFKQRLAGAQSFETVAADVLRQRPVQANARPRLLLLVVGETARAQNFSLNGYSRKTNPELAQVDLINFTNTHSCGTATAVSLPCMFQEVGKEGYKDSMANSRETLLDVLKRAGIQVLWRDNNSGCKGVCDRVDYEDVSALKRIDLCADGECHDGVLLDQLQQKIDAIKDDTLIVLHMKGSHGPAYYKRYPKEFEHFTPVCRDSQLDNCQRQEIINAYDNSLRYSDHVLAQSIDLLKANQDKLDTALWYLSDHGESLGENGVYLHGLPYALAPEEQTKVPMFLWLSPSWQRDQRLDLSCLKQRASQPASQDNLYHSILGIFQLKTSVYKPQLDLLSSCQNGRATAQSSN